MTRLPSSSVANAPLPSTSTRRIVTQHVNGNLSSPHLARFETHGYQPCPNLTDDVNYMDMVMIVTRSSMTRQGSMGCILVRPSSDCSTEEGDKEKDAAARKEEADGEGAESGNAADRSHAHTRRLNEGIFAAATNSSLFKPNDSDVHAEINAIGQVARRSESGVGGSPTTEGATIYITMPPCKRCFCALHASGVSRVVSRKPASKVLLEAAKRIGMEMVHFSDEELVQQKERMDLLFSGNSSKSLKCTDGNECSSGDYPGRNENNEQRRKKHFDNNEEMCTSITVEGTFHKQDGLIALEAEAKKQKTR